MGGSLFKVERLQKESFEIYKEDVLNKLSKPLFGIRHQAVPYYREKESFGDLDIVIEEDAEKVTKLIMEEFGWDFDSKNRPFVINDGIISFEYKKFQIDLICRRNKYDAALNYLSYNDVGNILGRIFHKLGLKYGMDGLSYILRYGDKNPRLEVDIPISKDQKKILEFIGLDYSRWENGFSTLEDIFSWVTTSRFFDSSSFDRANLSAINLKRDRKRTTYMKFLDYVESEKPLSKHTFDKGQDKANHIEKVDSYFGSDIRIVKENWDKIFQRRLEIKEKFNGRMVNQMTGLQGPDLGKFLEIFTKAPEIISDHGSFDDYVMSNEIEKIEKDILSVFEKSRIIKGSGDSKDS